MVRRHSLPPHALKRQNSRFKIGAGVAAAAGAGAALLAVGLCLRLTPPPAVPAPTPARVEQPWEVVDRQERLGSAWPSYATEVTLVRGKKNQNSRRKAQLTIAHREPMTGIIKKFLTPQEVADVRKGMKQPFEAYAELEARGPAHGDAAFPLKNFLIQRNETRQSPVLHAINERLIDLAKKPEFAGPESKGLSVKRLEGGVFMAYDGAGFATETPDLIHANAHQEFARNPRTVQLEVFLTDGEAPFFPFGRSLDEDRDPLGVCASILAGEFPGGAGGKRARGAARGGGQEYWRKLYRDVDYGDQHDVARFHEIYGNVTRDEATFTEAAAAENLRGGPDAVARLCAWVAVHRSMRSCETRAPYQLKAGDAVVTRVGGVRSLRGSCGGKARLVYTLNLREKDVSNDFAARDHLRPPTGVHISFTTLERNYKALRDLPAPEVSLRVEIKILRRSEPARWRGDAVSSPLDGASPAASSPRIDLVKNYRTQTHRLISTQVSLDALERILEPFFMLCHRPQGDPPTRRDLPKVRDLLKYREALVQAFGAAFSPKPAPWAAFSKLSKAEGVQRRVLAMQAAMAAALQGDGDGAVTVAVAALSGTLKAAEVRKDTEPKFAPAASKDDTCEAASKEPDTTVALEGGGVWNRGGFHKTTDYDAAVPPNAADAPDDKLIVTAPVLKGPQTADGKVYFKVLPTTPLGHLFSAYSTRQEIPLEELRWSFDGKVLDGKMTPADVGLAAGGHLDVALVDDTVATTTPTTQPTADSTPVTDAEPRAAVDEVIKEVEAVGMKLPDAVVSALTAPDEAAAPEPTPTTSETTGDDAEPQTLASDPSPAPTDNASELPTPADATAGSSPPPGPKAPKKKGLRLFTGEKGAETLAASVTASTVTTTLLDPSHEGEDENDDEVASTTTTRLDPPLEGEEYDDDKDDSVEDAVLDPEPEGAEDPTAELKRLAEENAELRRQLAASAKGGDA